jgi:uncharacterized protein YndB with AHSA1/START domain
MPTKKDDSGRRSVEVEFELPGTPEQIWDAIATGPGITSWFVPSGVEPYAGGKVAFHLGPGMDSTARVTAWERPRRFAYEEPGWSGDAPPLATEFLIESRAGGTCTLRIVHRLFTSRDDWDDQIDSMEGGWRAFVGVLRTYLAYFAGMRAASVRPTVRFAGSHDEAWDALTRGLGLSGARAGETRDTSRAGGPRLVGTVEHVSEETDHRELMMRLDQPGRGVALVGTYVWAERVNVAISLYFYGEHADALAAREAPVWQQWLDALAGATTPSEPSSPLTSLRAP